MKRFSGLAALSLAACLGVLMLGVPASAQRSGGGGGGGGNRGGGRYGLVFDYALPINGSTPVCVGSATISTYVTTLNVSLKVSSCDLPNGTPLTVVVDAVDWYTGQPWATTIAGSIVVADRRGTLVTSSLYVTPPGGVPVITSVTLLAPDGTVVLHGHP